MCERMPFSYLFLIFWSILAGLFLWLFCFLMLLEISEQIAYDDALHYSILEFARSCRLALGIGYLYAK